MSKLKAIRSAEVDEKSPAILGVYEGECADANITNDNGLDITREVWEHVFASEDYRKGIEHGWFIGFLGHPADPGCQEFKNGCIIMTEGRIDDDGKVYGRFKLLDTPVGRIVKTYIDADVEFGISVRGAGDIVNNSVDPETFVFRGFDLVAFPAFPDSIPTFSEIAASTDVEVRKKYKAVCAAVDTNIKEINTKESLEQLKAPFAPQSTQYKEIEARISELDSEDEPLEDINELKLSCMTDMYLDKAEECKQIKAANEALIKQLSTVESTYNRKVRILNRVLSSQQNDLASYCDRLEVDLQKQIAANKELSKNLSAVSSENLTYKRKINASSEKVAKQASTISDLKHQLDETVVEAEGADKRSSNLDAKVRDLKDEISATRKLLNEYQAAYAQLYSSATGVDLSSVPITSTTSVKELHSLVMSNAGTPVFASSDPIPVDVENVHDADEEYDLVTL